MPSKPYLAILSLLMLLILFCAPSQAQRPRRGYYQPPAGPTLSPYLLYSRFPNGIYDNYNAFVRPRVNLRRTLRAQNYQIQQVEGQLDVVEGEVRTLSEVRDAGINPTGVGGSYMNFSHYYPAATGR